MDSTDHDGQPAASAVVRYGPADHETMHPDIASRMLTDMHEDAPGLFGHYLLRAMQLRAVAPSKAQRQAAPDTVRTR